MTLFNILSLLKGFIVYACLGGALGDFFMHDFVPSNQAIITGFMIGGVAYMAYMLGNHTHCEEYKHPE